MTQGDFRRLGGQLGDAHVAGHAFGGGGIADTAGGQQRNDHQHEQGNDQHHPALAGAGAEALQDVGRARMAGQRHGDRVHR